MEARSAAGVDDACQKKRKKKTCHKTNRVRERLQELFPDVLFVTDVSQLCLGWDTDLSTLQFCTDIYIERFLQATKLDVDSTVLKLQHCFLRRRAAIGAQSIEVDTVLRSNRFRYIGHSRSGAVVVCVDFLWGKFLDVDGGLETVMQAMEVFYYRTLWSTVERDIGRRAALHMPPVSLLCVGGTPPIHFARKGLQFFSDHYPDGLALLVAFNTNTFQGVLARTAFRFLPNASQYHYTNDRKRLLEILDVDDEYIPAHLLYIDVPPAQQLSSTAMLDREWGQELRDHGHVCMKTDEQCVVKNTFVEVLVPDATDETHVRRDRAYSDDDGTWEKHCEVNSEPHRNAVDEAISGRAPVRLEGAARSASCSGIDAITTDTNGLLGRSLQSIVHKSTKPQISNKRQVSGFTRRRRKQAMLKLQQDLEASSQPVSRTPPERPSSSTNVGDTLPSEAPVVLETALAKPSVGMPGWSAWRPVTVNACGVLSNVIIAMRTFLRRTARNSWVPWLLLTLLVFRQKRRRALRRRSFAT